MITADFVVMFRVTYCLPSGCRRTENRSIILRNFDYSKGWKKRIQEYLDIVEFGLSPRIIACGVMTDED